MVFLVAALIGSASAAPSGSQASAAGRTLFRSNCGSCHTLRAAKTHGTYGPNLDRSLRGKTEKKAKRAVLRATAKGPGGMPPGILTGADADAVAAYVAKAVQRRRR